MRPSSLLVRKYLARGAGLWVGVRLLASATLVMAGEDPLRAGFLTTIFIAVAACTLALLDAYVRRERALLENLGVSRRMLVTLFAGPALAGELCLLVVTGARP